MTDSRAILIIDDEAELCRLLSNSLRVVTDDVRVAHNGVDALKIVETGDVVAILTDISMPSMNGVRFMEELRARGLDIPVVVLTAHADMANIKHALRLGATDFLEKPAHEQTVIEAMQQALELGVSLRNLELEFSKTVNSLFSTPKKPLPKQAG